MGLDGRLVGSNDEEFEKWYKPLINQMSEFIAQHQVGNTAVALALGTTKDDEDFVERIGHYSGVQLLRSYAAHIAVHGKPPEEEGRESINTELDEMYEGKRPFAPFDHLINHSDAEGFYVPVDFKEPFVFQARTYDGEGTWDCYVGSSQRLLHELDELNKHLKMPGDYGDLGGFEPLSKVVDERPYGAECWVWAVLHWFARASVERNLLLEFC